MLILILSREYAPDAIGGGIGSHLAGFAPALVARGHEVHVLSCVRGQARSDHVQDGVVVHRRPMIRLRGLGAVLRSPSAATRISTALSCMVEARRLGVRPDVVHMPDWMAEGLFFALRDRRPTVANLATPLHLTTRHNGNAIDTDVRRGDAIERAAVRRATVLVSTSRLLADDLGDWLGGLPVVVIPPPVDVRAWADVVPASEAPPTILAVGRVEHRKGADVLIDAAAQLRSEVPELEVVFVGRSAGQRGAVDYAEWIAARARARGVGARFAGQVARDDLPGWYSQARVVAVPSRYDSFSVTALEGMAAARPVVLSSTTGAGELLTGHRSLIVAPDAPDALAAALLPFLLDGELARRTGEELRALVEATCSPARIAELREEVYRQAVETHRRGRSPLRRT